jgi:hypothetical protein
MNVSEILSDESKWCKETWAILQNGKESLHGNSSDACQWCLDGALERKHFPDVGTKEWEDRYNGDLLQTFRRQEELFAEDEQKLKEAIQELYPAYALDSPVSFNDSFDVTFEMVRAVVLKAGV